MAWQAIAWRVAAWDTPLWIAPNARAGRYNRAGSRPTQYLCLHPWGPWAELLRADDRRTEADLEHLATRLWALRISLPDDPHRIDFASAPDPTALVDTDHRTCQQLADDADREGFRALVVPSAALPGTQNLVLFGAAVAAPWHVEPIDGVDVPCAVLADQSRPPADVLGAVCFRGRPHAGLAAWQEGRELELPVTGPIPVPG